MSKELEALNRMVSFDKKCEFIPQQLKDDFQLIEQALKRNEPMKVDLTTECDWFYNCPNCKGYNVMERSSYCPDCGQRLDWSDEK